MATMFSCFRDFCLDVWGAPCAAPPLPSGCTELSLLASILSLLVHSHSSMPIAPFVFSTRNSVVCENVCGMFVFQLTNLGLPVVYLMCMVFGAGEGTGTECFQFKWKGDPLVFLVT